MSFPFKIQILRDALAGYVVFLEDTKPCWCGRRISEPHTDECKAASAAFALTGPNPPTGFDRTKALIEATRVRRDEGQRLLTTATEAHRERSNVSTRLEISRCDKEIDKLEAEVLAGGTDMEGLLQGITDWSAERRLLFRRLPDPGLILSLLADSCTRGEDAGFWILTSAGAYLAGYDMCDGEGSSVAAWRAEQDV